MRFLGIPRHHRLLSRVSFYALAILLLWVLGLIAPRAHDASPERQLGVARAYIAEPAPEGLPDSAQRP